jgi:hypothetical protein
VFCKTSRARAAATNTNTNNINININININKTETIEMSVPVDTQHCEDFFLEGAEYAKAVAATSVVPEAVPFGDVAVHDAGAPGLGARQLPFPAHGALDDKATVETTRRAVAAFAAARLAPRVTAAAPLPAGHPDAAAVARLQAVPLGVFVARLAAMVAEPASVLAGLALLDRFYARHPGAPFSSVNAHRLVLIAVVVGAKWVEDVPRSNGFWARQLEGVFDLDDVNGMEVEFVNGLGCDIRVDDEAVVAMLDEAVAASA